jgi:hypothetical protein
MRVSPNKPPRFSASALLSLASIIPIRTEEGKPPRKRQTRYKASTQSQGLGDEEARLPNEGTTLRS